MVSALLTISAAAVGPFSQQATKTISCERVVKNDIATVPIANFIDPLTAYYRTQTSDAPYDLDYSLKGILTNALANGSDDALTAAVCIVHVHQFQGSTPATVTFPSKLANRMSLTSHYSVPQGTVPLRPSMVSVTHQWACATSAWTLHDISQSQTARKTAICSTTRFPAAYQ